MNSLFPPELKNLQRFSMPEAEKNLSNRFELNWDAQMQDWDLNNANAELLPVLLKALSEPSFSDDELYSLMSLTIASLDEALQLNMNSKSNKAYVSSLESLLRKRPGLYASAILYWAEPALREVDEEEHFSVSRHMAILWKQLLPSLISDPAN
jgi:hypothetical protein